MDKSAKSKLVNDIENRLDDFFGDENEADSAPAVPPSMEKLKSAVLSIDWEITDACLTDLISETDALLPRFESEPIIHALLRMLRALGGYIRKRKAQSHQDAIKRVMSVFASLETLVQDRNLDEAQRRQIVVKEIAAFKKLKEQVELKRAAKKPIPAASNAGASAPAAEMNSVLAHHQLKEAMHAVEERLNSKVSALKAELASLQQEIKTLKH